MKTTQTKFFEILSEIRRPGFYMNDEKCIRRKRSEDCPVVAVAKRLTGKQYANCAFDTAAAVIGLDDGFAESIVEISDGESPTNPGLARKLFVACGLEGVAT